MLQRIKKDLLEARKKKDTFLVSVLTALVSEGTAIGKNNGNRETTEDEMVALIQKFKKNIQETLKLLDCQTQFDKCQELEKEIELYERFLPKQLSKEEIVSILENLKKEKNDLNIGLVMKYFKENFSGQYDGKELSSIVREKI